MEMSKTEFKAHALKVFRDIEESGEPIIITDHGTPKLEIRKLPNQDLDILLKLKGSVIKYDLPTSPIDIDDWENA